MIKWIITDLDGTLFQHDKEKGSTIDSNTLKVWNNLALGGKYKMTIATGRHYANVLQLLEHNKILMPKEAYIIGMNGAQIYSTNEQKLILNRTFEREDTLKLGDIIDYLNNNQKDNYLLFGYSEDEKPMFYHDNKANYVQEVIDEINSYEDGSGAKNYEVIENFENIEKVSKAIIVFRGEWDYKKEVEQLSKLFPQFQFVKSSHRFLEILYKDTTKLNSLIKLNETDKFQPNEMIVFGDSFNDYEMLSYSKNAVTRTSADIEIQKICSHVIDAPESVFVGDGLEMLLEE
ncbi:MAG: HAD-IIB family hydrolase [Mycoplasma sp.]